MSHHVVVRLPDGRDAVANYDDPIVKVMRRIHVYELDSKKTVRPEDIQEVTQWLDQNADQSALCRETIYRSTFRHCTHR